jgi:hypothetical protein
MSRVWEAYSSFIDGVAELICAAPSKAFNALKRLTFYKSIMYKYPIQLINYKNNVDKITKLSQSLNLNFRRRRFFPTVSSLAHGDTYITLSLGLFAKFFNKGKSFLKSKSVYLALAGFLRKVLLFSSIKNFFLFIKRTPLYLNEILAAINNPVVNIYKHPFTAEIVTEKSTPSNFYFPMIIFLSNKSYGYMKSRSRGRLKRKIFKRLVASNRVLD